MSTLRKRRQLSGVVLYQAMLLVTFIAAISVLLSPSTMTFFILEMGVALTLGVFAYLKRS